jgi:hypothetical protein
LFRRRIGVFPTVFLVVVVFLVTTKRYVHNNSPGDHP